MTLSELLDTVPAIARLVTQIERPGYGKLKRETVVDLAVEGMIAANGEERATIDKVEKYVGIVVDDLVRMFNETGQFSHSTVVEVQREAQ